MSTSDEFDQLLTTIGFGPWQIPCLFLTGLIGFLIPFQLIGATIQSGPMNFHCSYDLPPAAHDGNLRVRYINNGTYFDNTCLYGNQSSVEQKTRQMENGSSYGYFTGLSTCRYIEYDTSIYSSTVVSEWNLVCENEGLVHLFPTLYSAGSLFGSMLGGYLGDRYGRKRAILAGSFLYMVAVIIMAFIPYYSVVLAMRFLAGCTNYLILMPAWSLTLECSPSRHRSLIGMLLGFPYSVGIASTGGISYLIRRWRILLLVFSSPIVLILLLAMCLDESPSWLIQRANVEEATKILKKAATRNKTELSFPTLAKITVSSESNCSRNERDSTSYANALRDGTSYLNSTTLRIILLTTSVLWLLQPCLYLSVATNANNFSSTDPFLYVMLMGVMDGSAILLSTPLATRFGRKIMIFSGMFFGALLFLLDTFIPADHYWVKWICVMAGFFLVGESYQVNFIYAPELFPTAIRTRGMAFLNTIGHAGFICAPLVTNILTKHSWWATGTFFGCAGILGSMMVPFLPETRNKALPETLQDIENRRNKPKKEIKNGEFNTGFTTDQETKEEYRRESIE